MKYFSIEEVEVKTKSSGEVENYFRVNADDTIEGFVYIGDNEEVKTVEQVVEYCIDNLSEEDSYYCAIPQWREGLSTFKYNGEYHNLFEIIVSLEGHNQVRYMTMEPVKELLEEKLKEKFGFNFILECISEKNTDQILKTKRGYSFKIHSDIEKLTDKKNANSIKSLGFTGDINEDTELLIKLLNCSIQIEHNLYSIFG